MTRPFFFIVSSALLSSFAVSAASLLETRLTAAIIVWRWGSGIFSQMRFKITNPPTSGAILSEHMCGATPKYWPDAASNGGR